MSLMSWIRRRNVKQVVRSKRMARPTVEQLEDRCVPTLFTVNLIGDTPQNGFLTLREAVALANADTNTDDTIDFAASIRNQTITLTQDQLDLNGPVTIQGPGAAGMTISGGGTSRIFQVNAGVTATITGLTLTQGQSGGSGGAVINNGNLTVDACVFTNSNSGNSGGAIWSGGDLLLRNSTFHGNSSGRYGGAIYNANTVTIYNCTLADNHAGRGGGALSDDGGDETFTIVNCTIVNNTSNTAGSGGGIDSFDSTSITLGNTILAGNTAAGAPLDYEGSGTPPPITSLGGNILSTPFPNPFGPGDRLISDPRLDPAGLRDNGGRTPTIALLPDSPAIDAGVNSVASDAGLTTDQRGIGFVRLGGNRADSGAFETQSIVADLFSDESDGNFAVGDVSLREAFEFAQAFPQFSTIVLRSGQTYTLDSALPALTMPLTIRGNGATIRANSSGYRFLTVEGGGNLMLDRLTIRDFNQNDFGGAISVGANGVLAVSNSAFVSNHTESIGGAVDLLNATSSASFVNTTFSGNTAASSGGAISSFGELTLVDCTLTGNTADFDGDDNGNGGGIVLFAGTAVLSNTIVAGNFDLSAPGTINPDVRGPFGSLGGNLIGAIDGSTGFGVLGDRVGTAAAPLDPLLGPLTSLGHAPIPGSPAIDAGRALGDVLLTPLGVTSSTAGNDFFPVAGLLGNSGLSAVPTLADVDAVTQDEVNFGHPENSWVTEGFGADYFASGGPAPVLTFDLPQLALLSDIVVWGYPFFGLANNNEAKTLSIAFSTDGGTTFGPAVTVTHRRTGAVSDRIPLGGLFAADAVRVTILDNYFGALGAGGGDRVGLGEVKFIQQLPETDQPGQARIQGAAADIGAVEMPALFGDAFKRDDSASVGAPWVNRVGSLRVQSQEAMGVTTAANLVTVAGRNHADVEVQARISLRAPGQTAGVVARYSGSGNSNYYSGVLNFSSSQVLQAQIRKNVNGVVTILASVGISQMNGRLRLEVTGVRLNLYLNDTRLASVVDATFKGGLVGVFTNGLAALDDFAAFPVLGSLPFAADFDRPDGTALDPRWTVSNGTFNSQGFKLQGTAANNYATLVGVTASDVIAQAEIAVPNTAGQFAGLVLRGNQAGTNYYVGEVVRTAAGFVGRIVRVTNGTRTTLSTTPPEVIFGGITGTLRFEVAGHRLQLFLNDLIIASAFDTTFGAGAVGVRASNQATLDHFLANLLSVDNALFQDSFEQVNGTPLSRSWTDRVGSYTVQNGAAVGSAQVNLTTLVGLNQVDAAIRSNVAVTAVGQTADLLLRYSGPGDSNYYAARLTRNASGFVLKIIRNVNGVTTTLKSAPVGSGTGQMIFTANGDEMIVSFAGTQIAAKDGTFTTGRVGFRSSAGAAMQDFQTNPILAANPSFNTTFPEAANTSPAAPATHLGSYLVKNGAAVGQSAVNLATRAAVVYADVDVRAAVNLTAVGQSAGLLARYRGAGDRDYYLGELTRTATGFTARIVRNLNGVRTVLTSVPVAGNGTLRFMVVGSQLTLILENTLVSSAVDFTLTSGAAGMRSTLGARLESLSIAEA